MNRIDWSASVLLIVTLLLCSSMAQAMTASIVSYQLESSSSYDRSLTIEVDGETTRLMLSPSYVTTGTTIVSPQGTSTILENQSFTGIVQGEKDSWVRLSLGKTSINDKTSINGVFSKQGRRFEIATDQSGRISVGLLGNHQYVNPLSQPRSRTRNVLAINTPKVTRIAKIGIVIDSQYNAAFNGNGVERALSIINSVDGIYREQFGLGLVVSKVVNITDRNSDPLVLGPVPIEQILNNFRSYRLSSVDLTDVSLVHLFSGNTSDDDQVGLAWIDTACGNDGYDIGVSIRYRHDILLAAHEIAHNLGAKHDTETACATQGDKVMWPFISTSTSQDFSSCSLEAVNRSLQNSCHPEAVDLQVTLVKSATDVVTATVKNNDSERANPAAVLSVDIPENVVATVLKGNCFTSVNDLKCDIATLLPGAEEKIVVQFDEFDVGTAAVNFEVVSQELADPQPSNNVGSLSISQGLITLLNNPTNALGASSVFAVGTGRISFSVLLILILLTTVQLHNRSIFRIK